MSNTILFGTVALLFALGGSNTNAPTPMRTAELNSQGVGGVLQVVDSDFTGIIIPLSSGASHPGLTAEFAGSI